MNNPFFQKQNKYVLIALALIIASGVFFGFKLVQKIFHDPAKHLALAGQDIFFEFTDDNSGENLIIRTDKKNYAGFNGSEVYFSITNESWSNQEVQTIFYFDDGGKGVKELYVLENEKWTPINEVEPQSDLIEVQPQSLKKRKSVGGFPVGDSFTDYFNRGETKYFKAVIYYPAMSKGKFFMESLGSKDAYGHLDPWYDSGYTYRKKITIDADKVIADVENFPLLATSTDTDLRDTTNGGKVASSTGGDIIFTDSSGALLNFEQEKYDNTTGEIVYWIKTDISSTTDTVLYMYYGNPSATDQQNITGVWDSNYKGVWHLNDAWNASSTDSTLNDNDGTTNFYSATSSVAGQAGNAIDFDGVDDYVDCGNNSSLEMGTKDMTFSAWVQFDVNPTAFSGVFEKGGIPASTEGYNFFYYNTDNDIRTYINDGASTLYLDSDAVSVEDNTWHYITASIDRSANAIYYLDGDNVGSESVSTFDGTDITNSSRDLRIGRHGNYYFEGPLDEARISDTARSAGWIKTEYNNQKYPGDFVTFYPEEENTRRTKINTSQKNFLTNGLVGYWTMDGQDVDWWTGAVSDVSGQGNNGTVNNMATGTAPAIGVSGQALDFDGTDDYVMTSYNPTYTSSDDFSIAFWYKSDDTTHTADGEFVVSSQAAAPNAQVLFEIDGDGSICSDDEIIFFAQDSQPDRDYVCSNEPVNDTNWHHVTGVYDIDGDMDIYIDGVKDNSTAVTSNSNGTKDFSSDPFEIGAGDSTQYFDGIIDEVRIYNRALSQSEITALYEAGEKRLQPNASLKNYKTSGLVGHWTFNGQDMDWGSNTAYDRSGQGNNGVMTNMSTSTSPAMGISGQALDFDGTDDYVDLPDSSNTNFVTNAVDFTISVWVNPSITSGARRRIIHRTESNSPENAWNIVWDLDNSAGDGDDNFAFDVIDNGTQYDVQTSGGLAVDTWYHIVAVWKDSSNTVELWKNSVLYTTAVASSLGDENDGDFHIGTRGIVSGDGDHFDGSIDEVRIYNRALSASEVLELYQAGNRKFKRN